MYEVSYETIAHIRDEFEAELNKRDYNHSRHALDDIFDTWLQRKATLIDILSKHPNWDPKGLMIRFDEDYSRKIDTNKAREFLYWLHEHTDIRKHIIVMNEEDFWSRYTANLYDYMNAYLFEHTYLLDHADFDTFNSFHESFRFRAGMKATKVMKKICSTFGWDKITGKELNRNGELVTVNLFEREYAKYCDAMCPIKVTRHTCISVNPVDFLLMSNGNSWRSCHYIGDDIDDAGCYSSGTISLMLDEHSMVFYTVDASFDGEDIEREPKIQRQLFGYNDYQLVQSRLYPQDNDYGANDIYTDIRNVVQKVFADCLDKPNLWVKKNITHTRARSGDYATCYDDWISFSGLCSVSILKEKADEDLSPIEFGAEPICIECGYHYSCEENISCCYSEGHRYTCADCGRSLGEDDVYWVDGEAYCGDCVTWCSYCEEYERNDYIRYVESYNGYVCDDCLNRSFSYCDCCNEYHCDYDHSMTLISSTDEWVCESCLENYYTLCEECDEYFPNDDIEEVEYDGTTIHCCSSCAESLMEDEEEKEAV